MSGFPEARRGLPITPELWNAARDEVRRARLLQGAGIRLHETPEGTIISADAGGSSWNHPFRVFYSAKSARIRTGWVNGRVEPTIKGVPLSGSEEEEPPMLRWNKPSLDGAGRGYIALEATFDEKWELPEEDASIEVIQCAR